MFKNTASQKLTVFCFDSTTNLPKTGDAANLTAYRDLDDGGVTVLTDTTATEKDATNAKGYYIFDLTQAETNGDKILFSCKSSTANIVCIAVPAVVYTLPATGILAPATAGRTLVVDAAGLADANMVKAGPSGSGTAQTAGDIIGDTNDIQTRLPAALVDGRMDSSVGAMAANVLTAAATAADFGTEIAAAVWDALTSGMSTVGSIGKKLADWVVGTIDTYTGNTKQTGDAYDRLGAPAGASIAADIAAIPAAVGALVVHTGITLIQSLRMIGAMVAGKTAGAGTGTVTFRNPIDTLDAMIITMTGSNRTATTKDLSA